MATTNGEQIKFHGTDDPIAAAKASGQRINFGRLAEAIETPNLIEVQRNSYKDFPPEGRSPGPSARTEGLQAVFSEVFPIESYDEKDQARVRRLRDRRAEAQPAGMPAREPRLSPAPLYVTFRLREDKNVKEERVYMGELPLMAAAGHFIINGAERVVVSQLHRSPASAFPLQLPHHSRSRFLARGDVRHERFALRPSGSQEAPPEVPRDDLSPRLGYSTDEEIIKLFYTISDLKLKADLDDEAIGTKVLIAEIRDTANADVVVARAFEPLTQAVIRQLLDLNIKTVKVIDIKDDDTIIKCLKKDPTHDTEEALKDIYRRLRPGDPPTVTNAKALLKRLFFDPKRYDIGRVGRYKINQKLSIDVDLDTRIITNEDIVAATQYVINLRRGEGSTDDIDHLGSRRVRTVGELLANQCRTGLSARNVWSRNA